MLRRFQSAASVDTADELRRVTRQFARDAAQGVEGVFWIDLATGARTPCSYRLEPTLGEVVFFGAPQRTLPVLDEGVGNWPASPSASNELCGRQGGGPPRTWTSGSTTASSLGSPGSDCRVPRAKSLDRDASPNGWSRLGGGERVAAAVEGQLRADFVRRIRLAGIREIWRPEQPRAAARGAGGSGAVAIPESFAADHAWYAAMSREERARLLCVDYQSDTACILERDHVARERFVVCAKVLRLSVS